MNVKFDVGIVHSVPLPAGMLQDITEPLEAAGADVRVEDVGPQVFTGIEWLLPTAIVVILSRKYIETILQEAAKDHYSILKTSLSKLLRRTDGKDREIRIQYIASTPNKLSTEQPGAISVYIETKGEQLIKFVFEDSLDATQHERCLDAIFRLMRDHTTTFPQDTLTRIIAEAQLGTSRALIMRFDPMAEQWYLWVPRL